MTCLTRVCMLLVLCAAAGCGRLRFEDLSKHELSGVDGGQDAAPGLHDEAGTQEQTEAGLRDATMSDAEAGKSEGGLSDGQPDGAADSAIDGAAADAHAPDASSTCAPGFAGFDCASCVRYADVNSKAANPDGLSWQTAFSDITAATVAAANASQQNPDPVAPYCQVWVRQGRFRLYVDSPVNTIALSPVAPIFGGFAGTEQDLSQRNIAAHPTILDGSDAAGVNHVYQPVYSTSGGGIDGFTITGGRANGTAPGPHADGGGLHVTGGMLVVRNVTFLGNTTTGNGGGIYAQNCVLTVDHCDFESNTADKSGGALAIQPSGTGNSASLTLTSSDLRSNVAGGNGGGLFASGNVTLRLANLVVSENIAGGAAGGLYAVGGTASLIASTFNANTSGSSASGLLLTCATPCTVINAILWDPSAITELALTGAAIRHSIVRGGAPGTAISSADPLFVSSPSNLHLTASSPAIDAGDGCAGPELDRDGLGRRDIPSVANSGVGPVFADRGAYEYQVGGTPYAAFSAICP